MTTSAVLLLADADEQPGAGTGSFWSSHEGHLLLLAAWVLVVGVAYLRTELRRGASDGRRRTPLPRSAWLAGAAAATVVSASIHLSVIGEHFRESALYGAFFLVLAALQLAWAAWLVLCPSRTWLLAGAAASVLVVLLWLATRTVGIPLGPAAGELEDFGVLDIVASAAEAAVAVFALIAVRGADGREPAPISAPLLTAVTPPAA